MRILHLSDGTLPDWRIEKSAISSKKSGYSIFFGGEKISNYSSVFDKVYEISWTPNSRHKFPLHWNAVKKQMINVIKEVRPDIIHAHNIFSAKMAKDIGGYPLVFDNHEYWAIYVKRQLEAYNISKNLRSNNIPATRRIIRNLVRDYIRKRSAKIWSGWEKDLVVDTPTITVSNTIVEDLKKIGNKVFLVPNFPLFKEIEPIREPIYHPSLSSVYAGVEAKGLIKPSHRNLEGFIEIFQNNNIGNLYIIGWDDFSTNNVTYRGFLKRDQMYKEMQDHSIGLLPFKNHWSHKFISPNKAYEYAHAGLFVMCTSGFTSVFDILQEHCMLYENNDDLKNKLFYMTQNLDELYDKRLKIYKYARNHILWEKYEKNIFEAYKVC